MKKNFDFSILLAMLLLAGTASAQKNNLERKTTGTYPLKQHENLMISNKYGEVIVETWDKDEVSFEVTVLAWGSSERDTESMLDRVEIKHGKGGDRVYIETSILSSKLNMNNRNGFEVNYKVFMPASANLDLTNKYGYTYLGNLDGRLRLDVAYGKLKTGKITGGNSDLNVSYGGADIEELTEGYIGSKYSSPINIEKAGNIRYDDKYGSFRIGEVNQIMGSSAYTKLRVGKLHQSIDVSMKYSEGSIEQISPGFSRIDMESSYGSIDIGLDNGTAFAFEVNTRFGSFKHSMSSLDIRKEYRDNSRTTVEGNNKGGGNAVVRVTTSYGSVRFR